MRGQYNISIAFSVASEGVARRLESAKIFMRRETFNL